MKTEFLTALVSLAALCAGGQGTIFLYDQQSSTDESSIGYGAGTPFQNLFPNTGQSFTPTFTGIDFIKLRLSDGNPGDGLGSTWFLNLRSTSITGPVLGTTASVGLPDGFTGVASFLFPSTIPLSPGTIYFFDINTPNGGAWNMDFEGLRYPGGTGWVQGQANPAGDYWFREGIIVPEPSPVALLLLGGAAFACFRRPRRS